MFPPVLWPHSQNDPSDATSSSMNTFRANTRRNPANRLRFLELQSSAYRRRVRLFTKLGDRRLTGAELGAELETAPARHRGFLRRARGDEVPRPRRRRRRRRSISTRPTAHSSSTQAARATSAAFSSCSTRGCSSSGMICRRRSARAAAERNQARRQRDF